MTVVVALISPWFIEDFPEDAKFLSPKEKDFVVHRLKQDVGAGGHFDWRHVKSAFLDWKSYVFALIYIGIAMPLCKRRHLFRGRLSFDADILAPQTLSRSLVLPSSPSSASSTDRRACKRDAAASSPDSFLTHLFSNAPTVFRRLLSTPPYVLGELSSWSGLKRRFTNMPALQPSSSPLLRRSSRTASSSVATSTSSG